MMLKLHSHDLIFKLKGGGDGVAVTDEEAAKPLRQFLGCVPTSVIVKQPNNFDRGQDCFKICKPDTTVT